MNIQESIIALLNGDMTAETDVAELMHVLAVSPEKRDLLVEQIRMSRAYRGLGSRTSPPSSADAAVLGSLMMIDAGFDPSKPAPASASGTSAGASAGTSSGAWGVAGMPLGAGMLALLGVALVALGLGGGYLAGYDYSNSESRHLSAASAGTDGDATFMMLAMAQDSLEANRYYLDRLGDRHAVLELRLGELERRHATDAVTIQRQTATIAGLERELDQARSMQVQTSEPEPETMLLPIPMRPARPASASAQASVDKPQSAGSAAGELQPVEITPSAMQMPALQGGFRWYVRHSLPQVFNLSPAGSGWDDKEIYASIALDRRADRSSPVEAGIALGRTQFSQVFNPASDGRRVDSLVEQSPRLMYGRGFISSELVRFSNLSASLELGMGGTEIGPLGTAGLHLEQQAGDHWRIFAGSSVWMLWSSLEGQVYTSTNLNGYWGIGYAL